MRAESSLLHLICTDVARASHRSVPSSRSGRVKLLAGRLLAVKSLATIGFRLAHHAGQRWSILGSMLKGVTHIITGADIDYRATIGEGFYLPHPTGVVISADTVIGARCTLHQGVTLGSRPDGSPTLGDDVNLAPGSRVIGPIVLGDNVHVGSNAVVTRSFPEGATILVGVPAHPLDRA